MKKTLLPFLFYISVHMNIFAQTPGGVIGKIYWISSENDQKALFLNSKQNINFYPSASINDKDIIDEIKSSKITDEVSVFVVLKPSFPQQEYQLVDINSDHHLISLQSDRIKSNEDLKIKNFDSDKPYFLNYLESFKEEELSKEESKSLGDSLQQKNYPNKFEGDIAEIIIYPKILSKLKKRKVETYLSLKYGISLPLSSDYINSQNDTIWKNNENRTFNYRLTGIGKDVNGNLDHKQSTNVDDFQFLTIGLGDKIEAKNRLNKNSWQDLNYLLWADDSGEMVFQTKEQAPEVSLFERTWRTKLIGENIQSYTITFSFDTDLIEAKSESNERQKESSDSHPELKYWLVFDSGTSDELNIQTAEFIQSVNIPSEGGQINFSGIPLKDRNESFLFTLAKAPEMFALVETSENECQSDAHLKIIGGVKPYKIEFYSDTNQKFPVLEKSENLFDILNLKAGNYTCKIIDSFGQIAQQKIFIKSDIQNSLILEDVFLKEGESRIMDLNQTQTDPLSDIVWMKDNQEVDFGERLILREEGEYIVNYTTEKGCRQTTSFKVYKVPDVEWSGIYPNPVKINEPFFVNLKQFSNSEIRLTIRDFSGRVIKSKVLEKGREIYSDTFSQQGTYTISVENVNEKENYKIIIK